MTEPVPALVRAIQLSQLQIKKTKGGVPLTNGKAKQIVSGLNIIHIQLM